MATSIILNVRKPVYLRDFLLLVQLPQVAVTATLKAWSLAFHMFLSQASFHNKDILPLGQFITTSPSMSPPTQALGIPSASS